MAMNKREQQEFESLKDELVLAKALHFTDFVEPDLPVSANKGSEVVEGFTFNEYGSNPRVEPSCSSKHYHGIGTGSRTTIQRGIDQYSTKLLALRALRNALEYQCARTLANIDQQIQKELRSVPTETDPTSSQPPFFPSGESSASASSQ